MKKQGRAMAQAVSHRPPNAEARVQSRVSMWDLWWTKWHWDRFFPEYFGFPLSISFHRCSITRKIGNNLIIIFIFITWLHNKHLSRDPIPQKKREGYQKYGL
jgi:hypothetical protein